MEYALHPRNHSFHLIYRYMHFKSDINKLIIKRKQNMSSNAERRLLKDLKKMHDDES